MSLLDDMNAALEAYTASMSRTRPVVNALERERDRRLAACRPPGLDDLLALVRDNYDTTGAPGSKTPADIQRAYNALKDL